MARRKREDYPRLGLKIEKNVPLKKRYYYRPQSEAGELARDMEVGNSVWCPNRATVEAVRMAMRHLGKRSSYSEAENEKGVWGYRIWRLPDER